MKKPSICPATAPYVEVVRPQPDVRRGWRRFDNPAKRGIAIVEPCRKLGIGGTGCGIERRAVTHAVVRNRVVPVEREPRRVRPASDGALAQSPDPHFDARAHVLVVDRNGVNAREPREPCGGEARDGVAGAGRSLDGAKR